MRTADFTAVWKRFMDVVAVLERLSHSAAQRTKLAAKAVSNSWIARPAAERTLK